jgi:hypothetical protein
MIGVGTTFDNMLPMHRDSPTINIFVPKSRPPNKSLWSMLKTLFTLTLREGQKDPEGEEVEKFRCKKTQKEGGEEKMEK